jgi:excisionase family DNA binding protein
MSRERAFRRAEWVAEFLDVPREWVVQAAADGTLPCIRVAGETRFDPDVIKAFGRPAVAAERGATAPTSASTSLREIQFDLRKLKSVTIQPGAVAITLEQAAARLGCSRSRIFEFLKAGRLKRAARVGRKLLLTLASVDELLAKPNQEPKARPTRQAKPAAATTVRAGIMALRDKYR